MATEKQHASDIRDGLADRRDFDADHRDRVASERDVTAQRRGLVADERDLHADRRDSREAMRDVTQVEITGLWECMRRIEQNQREMVAEIKNLSKHGCAKAALHAQLETNQGTIFGRLRDIELKQAEGRGKVIILSVLASAEVGTVFAWIGGLFK